LQIIRQSDVTYGDLDAWLWLTVRSEKLCGYLGERASRCLAMLDDLEMASICLGMLENLRLGGAPDVVIDAHNALKNKGEHHIESPEKPQIGTRLVHLRPTILHVHVHRPMSTRGTRFPFMALPSARNLCDDVLPQRPVTAIIFPPLDAVHYTPVISVLSSPMLASLFITRLELLAAS
jgi:hypothetical protein